MQSVGRVQPQAPSILVARATSRRARSRSSLPTRRAPRGRRPVRGTEADWDCAAPTAVARRGSAARWLCASSRSLISSLQLPLRSLDKRKLTPVNQASRLGAQTGRHETIVDGSCGPCSGDLRAKAAQLCLEVGDGHASGSHHATSEREAASRSASHSSISVRRHRVIYAPSLMGFGKPQEPVLVQYQIVGCDTPKRMVKILDR